MNADRRGSGGTISKIFKIEIIILILYMVFLPGIVLGKEEYKKPVAVNGVLDLDSGSLAEFETVELDGEWEFYWDRFIPPEEFLFGQPHKTLNLVLPGLWNRNSKTERAIPSAGKATLRLQINLDRDYGILTLNLPVIGSAYHLWVNGEKAAATGEMGPDGNVLSPALNYRQVTFCPKGRHVDLVLHVGNIEPVYPGTTKSILMGTPEAINRRNYTSLSFELFLLGSILIMGIYHLILYIYRKKDRFFLLFFILCLSISFRTLIYDEVFYNTFFSNVHWLVTMRAYIITTALAFIFFLLYNNSIFPKENKPLLLKIIVSAISASVVITIGMPVRYIAVASVMANTTIFLSLFYVGMVFYKAFRRKREGAAVILLTGIVVIAAIILDLLYSFHFVSYDKFTPIGTFVFLFFQAVVLSKKYSKAYYRAEKLAEENRGMYLEIKGMNEVLEEKVRQRTVELSRTAMELRKSMRILEKEVQEHRQARNEIAVAYEQIEILSRTDFLTGLLNRHAMDEKLAEYVNNFREQNTRFAICLCDVDDFKQINDNYGHSAGDYVLRELSDLLRKNIRGANSAGRWGGEEFILVLACTGKTEAVEVLEQLRIEVQKNVFIFNGKRLFVTMTFGLCMFDEAMDVKSCLVGADKALYAGKRGGKNRVVTEG